MSAAPSSGPAGSGRPAPSGRGASVPLVVRPRRLTRVCRALAAVLLLAFGGVAVSLRRAGDGQVFGVTDQAAMIVLGVLGAGIVLAFTRARVVADSQGARVRNVLGERLVPWQVVREVRLDDGSPWASLELQDDDTIALLALQANDGAAAVHAVLALRSLLRVSRAGGSADQPVADPAD